MAFAGIARLVFILCASLALLGCEGGGGSNKGKASVRMVNASSGYDSLDLYVNAENDKSDADSLALDAVGYQTVSAYSTQKAGPYTLKFKRSGLASTLQSLSGKNLGKDAHVAYIGYGATGRFSVLELGEDVGVPATGRTSLRIINVAEAGSVDVYLTEESVALEDASPVAAGVGPGTIGALRNIDSGAYRLRITAANDARDVRLDVSGVTFPSAQVASLIVTSTSGGVLVNALLMPQGGAITTYANTRARVRGAVGISSGSMVTARVGGVSVLSGAGVGVLGAYTQVPAGAAAVDLRIDGAPAAADGQTLLAGGEYTLLIWSDASGARTTMISDDNRLPSGSGKAKMRVVNGLSAMNVPITYAVDFSPIAEGVTLGQASRYAEVDAGSSYQLNVTDSNTAANLLTRTSVAISAAGVYTMLVTSSSGTVSGTLRKDR